MMRCIWRRRFGRLAAALISRRAATTFLILFGALYLADGVMGLALGSGYLDLGILTNGVLDLPFGFKILANTPHIALGGFALDCGNQAMRFLWRWIKRAVPVGAGPASSALMSPIAYVETACRGTPMRRYLHAHRARS